MSLAMSIPVSGYAITRAEWLAQIDTPVQTASTTPGVAPIAEPGAQSEPVAVSAAHEAEIAELHKQLQAIIVILTQILKELQIKEGITA